MAVRNPSCLSVKKTLLICAFVCVLNVMSGVAGAAEFVVRNASPVLHDKVYYLNARIEYTLSDKVLEALHKGVPITFMLEIEISRVRDYLWN